MDLPCRDCVMGRGDVDAYGQDGLTFSKSQQLGQQLPLTHAQRLWL